MHSTCRSHVKHSTSLHIAQSPSHVHAIGSGIVHMPSLHERPMAPPPMPVPVDVVEPDVVVPVVVDVVVPVAVEPVVEPVAVVAVPSPPCPEPPVGEVVSSPQAA